MTIRNFQFMIVALLMLALLGIVASDQYVWVGIMGLLTLVAFLLYPKAGLAFMFVILLVSQTLQSASHVTAVGYLDDVFVFVCVVSFSARRLLTKRRVRWLPALYLFMLYLVMGLVSSLSQGVALSTSLLTGFLFVKGPLLAFAVAQIDWKRDDIPKIIRFGGWLLAALLLTTMINVIAPGPWHAVLNSTQALDRVGYSSLTGIFHHPVGLGTTMSLSFIAVYLYRRLVHRSPTSFVLLLGAALANIFAFRRKSIVSMVIGSIFTRLAIPGGRSVVLAVLVVSVPLLAIISWTPLVNVVTFTMDEYMTDPTSTARTLMTRDSALIALTYFPLGAGLGRYGSHPARQDYSPEYVERGYQFIWGMGPGDAGEFLTDTFWPAVLGETGFFGLVFYAAGLLMLAVPAWRLMRHGSTPHLRWMGAVGIGWLVALLVESWVAPVFSSPPMYGLFPIMAGICNVLALDGVERRLSPRMPTRRRTARWIVRRPVTALGAKPRRL